MTTDVVKVIGAGGDYPTLAEFAADLPGSLVAADERWIASLGADVTDPGAVVIRTICDALRHVLIRSGAGDGAGDRMDPERDELAITPGEGALIDAAAGDALRIEGDQTRVVIERLQIRATAGAAIATDGDARLVQVTGCLVEANATDPAIDMRGGTIARSVVIQRGAGDGIALSEGAVAESCTVFKPEADLATGTGISFAGGAGARSSLAAGFGRAFGPGPVGAEALVSDQENLIAEPVDLATAYWTPVSALIDPTSTVTGPHGVALQWLGNNLNSFARFDASAAITLAPGERLRFSVVVGQPTALVSAVMLDGGSEGKPEVRVTWGPVPSVSVYGGASNFAARAGTVTDLGDGFWRIFIEAENASGVSLAPVPRLYVTRDVSNSGLNVGFFAGTVMATKGFLGAGFAMPGSVPGTGAVEGLDPAAALRSVANGAEDLRPVPDGPLAGIGVLAGGGDFYERARLSPDTVGAVTLNPAAILKPGAIVGASVLDGVRLIDRRDVLTAVRRRTVLPGSPSRRMGI